MKEEHHQKEFIKLIEDFRYKHQIWQVFHDFCEFGASALRLPFYGKQAASSIEAITKRYSENEIKKLDEMFTHVVNAIEKNYHDFLGGIFHKLELHNKWRAQFFTPYNVCLMMAEIQLPDPEKIKEKGFLTVNEPCVGAGAMLIALAEVMIKKGLNPSTHVYFVAQDVDLLATLMAYIQLSLCGMAGAVIWGNTITVECKSQFKTPVYFLNNWEHRILLKSLFSLGIPQEEKKPKQSQPMNFGFRSIPKAQQLVFNF